MGVYSSPDRGFVVCALAGDAKVKARAIANGASFKVRDMLVPT